MDITDKIIYGIIFPLMFCLIGGGLFARKGYNFFKTKRDKKCRCLSQTRGKIVDIHFMRINKRGAYFPVYEYTIGDKVFRVEIEFGTTYRQYKIGDEINIFYDFNYPDYSYIGGYKEDTFSAVACLLLGSVATLCGLYVGAVVWFG